MTSGPCALAVCALHATAEPSGCRSWQPELPGEPFDLVAIVHADRPADCLFAARVLLPTVAAAARRAHGRVDSDDLLAEVVLRVLERYTQRRHKAPRERVHLKRFVRTVLLDVGRRDTGRRRCTTCGHYRAHPQQKGGSCQRQYGPGGEPHPHFGRDLDSRAEPQRLDPQCHGYAGRSTAPLPEDELLAAPGTVRSVRTDDMSSEALERALARLIAEQPLRGLLFVQHKLDGRTYDDLGRQHGLSRDQVKRHIQAALVRVRELIREEAA